jgi:endonuclease YncB( thermonuclease family)
MAVVRAHKTVWLTRAPREAALRRARPRGGVPLLRAFALSVIAAGALTLGVSSVPPAPPARADITGDRLPKTKVADRVEAWNGPLAPMRAKGADVPPSSSPAAAWSLFGSQPAASLVQARFAPTGAPAWQSGTLAQTAAAPEWQEREFAEVSVVDGRTLDAAGVRIRLSGLALPSADEACRTLDGRIEACALRAATQLELITRWRKVTCRYRAGSSGEAAGSCRVGSSDLADRLVKTGYVRRLDAEGSSPRVARPI